MKILNTAVYDDIEASSENICEIIDSLHKKGDINKWMTLEDEYGVDYVQIHSRLEWPTREEYEYIVDLFFERKIDIEELYLVEMRKYDPDDLRNYTHYRALMYDEEKIKKVFLKFYNDEEIDCSKWFDVTLDVDIKCMDDETRDKYEYNKTVEEIIDFINETY